MLKWANIHYNYTTTTHIQELKYMTGVIFDLANTIFKSIQLKVG